MQEPTNYARIATAIDYIKANFKQQPGLDEVAEKVHISPFHFQRMFRDWAGVSPKKFLQYLSLEHAKSMLKDRSATLSDAACETGLSGTGRLHDLFIGIEAMTPGEYKNGGEALAIHYHFAESPFGEIIIASTSKGICHLAFADNRQEALSGLRALYPNAIYRRAPDPNQQHALSIFSNALSIFSQDWSRLSDLKLHVKGTPFQLKVWEALLRIPPGRLVTYSALSQKIGSPGASRAVGSAVGSNPVAFLIPCHRVILSTGQSGQYHWGSTRKAALIGWEAARTLGE
jgi:AraC family transcriptional regulator, regulatory protein of adaptative response / methylated-DNA-[protein]-cysteine methyltransferase